MPDINGTNGNDDIDVSNNNGTLNGTPQGTPIDNVRGQGGNDTIDITNSTVSGVVLGNAGSDTITITNSTVDGRVGGGSGTDTVNVSGSAVNTIRLGNSNDTLNFSSTTVSGDLRGGSGTDTLNLPVGTVINDNTFGTITVQDGVSYSLSTGSFTLPSGITVSYRSFENGSGVPCFTRDTQIRTNDGLAPIQDLRTGDLIPTMEHGLQPIRWIGRRSFEADALRANPRLCPVRILAGALGEGLPHRDLLVSRQHRMLVRSRIAKRMFGASEVLIPAIKLTALPGIFVDDTVPAIEYFHLLFDRHQVIFAEYAPTESLFTGPEALRSLSQAAKDEIFEIFPELSGGNGAGDPACFIPSGPQQARLVTRHLKNRKPLLQSMAVLGNKEFDAQVKISHRVS